MPDHLLPEEKSRDEELAKFADNLLDGALSEETDLELSDDLELRELQQTAFQIRKAFGNESPDPAMAARVKKSLLAEWKQMHKKRPFWAVWFESLSSPGRKGRQARVWAFAVAMIPLIAALALYTGLFTDIGDSIMGTAGIGYPSAQSNVVNTEFGENERVSIATSGDEGNADSIKPVVSQNGRYVVFQSAASNFMETEDAESYTDIFIFDRHRDEISRVSVGLLGEEANGNSQNANISGEGKYIVFESYAANLTNDDEAGNKDIFVYDRVHGTTERLSAAMGGGQANGDSSRPVISNNGHYIAFSSTASNLVADDNNGFSDIFVVERSTGITQRISLGLNGAESNGESYKPTISDNGRWIAFESWASNLTENETGNKTNIFIYNIDSGITKMASVNLGGNAGNNHSFAPKLAGDGSALAFYSAADDLVADDTNGANDIFVYNVETGLVERVSMTADGGEADSGSAYPDISSNGRYVIYTSFATNLVGDDDQFTHQDVFLYDRNEATTQRVSINANNGEPNNSSINPSIGENGRLVVFDSGATDIVANDNNGRVDVFLRDRLPQATLSMTPHIGANGSYFSIIGDGFTAGTPISIIVNGQELGTVSSYDNGAFDLALYTPNTDPGSYLVTAVDAEGQGIASFTLDPSAPIIEDVEDGLPTLEVPAGIAAQSIYLPILQKQ